MDPLSLIAPAQESSPTLILTADKEHTREQLMRLAGGVAASLREIGAARPRVVVSVDNGPAFFAGLVGSWLAGATPLLLDPLVKRELNNAVQMTGARAVVQGSRSDAELPEGVERITPGNEWEPPGQTPPMGDDDPVLFLFTSGSTGTPTLVPKTFSQIDVEVRFISDLFESPRRVATMVPWCHIWGLLASFLVPLRMGGVCDLSAGISPHAMLARAADGLTDLVVGVPAVYQVMVRCLEAGDLGPIPPSCSFAAAGAPLAPSLRARFTELTGCGITDIYGSTEAGGIAFRHDDGPWTVEPHVEIRIDPDGFLEVRSPSVSLGEPSGFYRVGDLVRPEGQGFVLVGREDDVVKIGGRRTALGEIQEVVAACPGVSRAAVLAEDVRGTLRIVAYVEPESSDFDPEAVKRFVRGHLADHKVPRVVRVVDQMPLASGGKVAVGRLRGMAERESR